MVEIENLQFEGETKEQYLRELSKEIERMGYPECDSDLVYSLLDSTYARDIADEIGQEEFAEDLRFMIDGVLEPFERIDPEKQQLGEFTDEELSIRDTSPLFYETIGSFTEVDGEVVHGGDIANEFINARKRDPARESLRDFEEWLKREVDDRLGQLGQEVIELENRQYTTEAYRDTAVYNGLRFLLHRRENMEPFSSQEMQVP